MKTIKISVHDLVDHLLRKGDLDRRVFNVETMQKGSAIHRYYQSGQNELYIAEYYFNQTFYVNDYEITLNGRADGLIVNKDEVTIEEIKSSLIDIDLFHSENEDWHLGQAKCYAYMYALANNIKKINVTLTYISQVDNRKKQHFYTFTTEELKDYFYNLLNEYIAFYAVFERHIINRNKSIKQLVFPFVSVRKGQQDIVDLTTKSINEEKNAYIEAPTGIGKTMAVIYPSILSLVSKKIDKVFFLSAKGSGQIAAIDAVEALSTKGLILKTLVLTPKDRLKHGDHVTGCSGNDCIYRKGYYQKINKAISDIFSSTNVFDKQRIEKFAAKYQICPFEFQLDLSLFCDLIIGDYNYVFDNFVYLRRFFYDKQGRKYINLIDEAHNLVERVRDSYSTVLSTFSFLNIKQDIKGSDKRSVKKAINEVLLHIFVMDEVLEVGQVVLPSLNDQFLKALEKFVTSASVLIDDNENIDEKFKDTYFMTNRFLKLYDILNEDFSLYIEKKEGLMPEIKIFCLNPKSYINNGLLLANTNILFSATLSPNEYYLPLLNHNSTSTFLKVDNPFDRENLSLLIATSVETTMRKREQTYGEVADYILSAISGKQGNFMIFCPSFSYLEKIGEYLDFVGDIEIVKQVAKMDAYDRQIFLANFAPNPKKTHVGLTVVGGIFGEGVDLIDDRLSGVIIIGVGFPSMTFERDLITTYYDNRQESGRNYAYIYPGINKILQAMGRVIRSESDKGFILLIDKRYSHKNYNKIVTNYNAVINYVDNPSQVSQILTERIYQRKKE